MKYNQYRRGNGEWAKRRHPRGFWVIVAVVMLGYGGIVFFVPSTPVKADLTTEATTTIKVVDNSPEKIAKLKQETVDLISGCEVNNYKEGDAPIILDTNNKMSIGPMMFQINTVIHYEKKFFGRDVTRLEATNIALNESEAKDLAVKITFEEYPWYDSKKDMWVGAYYNWYNCSNRLNIETRVKLIHELEK